MKLILSAATAIVALITTTIAAPAPEGFTLEKRDPCKGHVNLVNLDWHASGGGYNRWKWAFAGLTCGEIHDSLNRWSLPNDQFIANRQCWDSGDGITFYFEHSTTKGEEIDGNVAAAYVALTGQSCSDMSLPDWQIGPCGDKVLKPASSMCQRVV